MHIPIATINKIINKANLRFESTNLFNTRTVECTYRQTKYLYYAIRPYPHSTNQTTTIPYFTENMATSHILSAIEPSLMSTSTTVGLNSSNSVHPNSNGCNNSLNNSMTCRSPDHIDRNLNVSLDDRDLWMRFQNLTNEMIVTKNGR